ncbi:hypothetical protein SNE40_005608 [Patella caerulea]|uniref:C3H1-type domain-containing protein n=1 Tax=Patella caerulea TaxID=87958 RepID=A0AAN8K8I6_PATCE
MAEDDFFVKGSKVGIVEATKERVLHLFQVDLCVKKVIPDNDNAKVHLSSTSISQENIKKAQTYLQAALDTGDDFVKEKVKLKQQEFNMVLNEYDNIERLTQVVLTNCKDTEEICIKGCIKNVFEARKRIKAMANKCSFSETTLNLGVQDHLVETFRKMNSDLRITDNNNVVTSVPHLTSDSLSARGRDPSSFAVEENLETDSSCAFVSYIYPPDPLTQSNSSSSSLETESERILSDPENSAHIEKALKLGYSDHQIVAVLKKLGVTAASVDPNTLLTELIKQGAMSPEVSGSEFLLKSNDDNSSAGGDMINDSMVDACDADDVDNLRHIVIDGSNVAMSHGNKEVFSCRGIQLAVEYFRARGHKKITVFVPQWRKESSRPDAQIKDQEIMKQLEKERVLVFTPSRRVGGRRIVCYDDRYVLDVAHSNNGIVVSNDNYRDLYNEKPQYKKVAEEQLLQYVFVDDQFMPPEDPLGKHGPTLDNFLRITPIVSEPSQPCPYGKKCTYGNKCRFSHPERGNRPHRSVTELLSEQSSQKLKDRAVKMEEKKKKEIIRKKQSLRRTQSMFPEEHASIERKVSLPNQGIEEDQPYTKASETDYNDMLNKHRLKLEDAERKSREASPVPKVAVQPAPPQTYKDSMCIGSEGGYVRELEPVTATLPPPTLAQATNNNSEQPLPDHLILAKKLSDDAQDRPTKFFDSDKNQSSPVSSTQWPRNTEDHSRHSQEQIHISQYGYPGSGMPPSEFGVCKSGPASIMRLDPVSNYEDQCKSYPFSERDQRYHQLASGWTGNQLTQAEHLTLTMKQSCPEHVPRPATAGQGAGNMMRQNSTSDPQLNSRGQGDILSSRGASSMMYRTHGSNPPVPINRSTSIHGSSFPQQHVQYNRQTSELPYTLNQYYPPTQYTQQHPAQYTQQQHHLTQYTQQHPVQYTQQQHPVQYTQQQHPGHYTTQQHRGQYTQPQQHPVQYTHFNCMNSPVPVGQMQPVWSPNQIMPQQQLIPQYVGNYQPPLQPPNQPSNPIPLTADIKPTDPRYSIYYHLLGLFDETKVKAAMNAHPNETNPQILVHYIADLQ